MGCGEDGRVKARLGMGAGKEVSSMGWTASTESWWRTVLDRVGSCQGRCVVNMVEQSFSGALTDYVGG